MAFLSGVHSSYRFGTVNCVQTLKAAAEDAALVDGGEAKVVEVVEGGGAAAPTAVTGGDAKAKGKRVDDASLTVDMTGYKIHFLYGNRRIVIYICVCVCVCVCACFLHPLIPVCFS
jgi:hypothetical protein